MTTPAEERKPITLTESQERTLIDAYIGLSGLSKLMFAAEAYELNRLEWQKEYFDTDVLHMVGSYVGYIGCEIGNIAMSD